MIYNASNFEQSGNGVAMTELDSAADNAPPHPFSLPKICFDLQTKIDAFLNKHVDDNVLHRVQSQVRTSLSVIKEALRRYGLEHLSLSYNGGKDCLVLLVLILACMPGWTSCPSHPDVVSCPPTRSVAQASEIAPSETHSVSSSRLLQAVYIVSRDPFPEVEEFVEMSAQHYHLDLKRYELPMRPALEAYLKDKPAVKAIFLGTRRTDPHSEALSHFNPTDQGWPQFMRIHPIIDWHYVEIWAFIRHLEIPFCELYNRGFTSLGGVADTRPNPALAVNGDETKFRPAYELTDDDEERLGRDP